MKKIIGLLLFSIVLFSGCSESFLEQDSTDITTGDRLKDMVKEDPEVVGALVQGIYPRLMKYAVEHDVFGQKSLDLAADLQTEDMVQSSHHYFGFDYLLENREYNYRRTNETWKIYYESIALANQALDAIPEESDAQNSELDYLKGQALALRGYCYYYLIRIWQYTYDGYEDAPGVPLVLTKSTEGSDRVPVRDVYTQIISDLEAGYALLEGKTRSSKVEINANATALYLSDVYLTMNNYTKAAEWAKIARTGVPLMSDALYQNGFGDLNNPEWIWGMDINSENTTKYASFFSHVATFATDKKTLQAGYGGGVGAFKLINSKLYDAIPEGDIRKTVFVGPNDGYDSVYFYTNLKFLNSGDFTQDYLYCRASEAYLIEAEALARLGNESEAQNVLYSLVSVRYPDYAKSTNTGDNLIEEILLQKRIELWGEGRALFDLKRLKKGIDRTGINNHRADAKLKVAWNDIRFVYQIPSSEIEANPNITEQNK